MTDEELTSIRTKGYRSPQAEREDKLTKHQKGEVPESIPVHQEYEDPKDAELTPEEDEFVEEIVKKAEEKLGEKIVPKEAKSIPDDLEEALEDVREGRVKTFESVEEFIEEAESVTEATSEVIEDVVDGLAPEEGKETVIVQGGSTLEENGTNEEVPVKIVIDASEAIEDLKKIEKQIAELQAKKEALEAKE